jgi:hypothetical protein
MPLPTWTSHGHLLRPFVIRQGEPGEGLTSSRWGGIYATRSPCPPRTRQRMGERLALAQVHQDRESLLAGVQLPPQRPERDPVPTDETGGEGQGPARQRKRSTIEKQGSPW